MARRELGVWLSGRRIATIRRASSVGTIECRYDPEALETWPGNIPLLSCSMPLSGGKLANANAFFRGLLPEGQVLQAMAAHAKVAITDTFTLLERYGRDVLGAVIVAAEHPGLHPEGVEPYTNESLEAQVAALPEQPLGLHDDSELSLPGLQNKLLLVALETGKWGRPIHGRPSTHILKVEDRRYPGMAAEEAECLRLARAAELTTVTMQVREFAGIPCLIVSRFDRVVADGACERIHQEDACQALGRDPEAAEGKGKYERFGGPAFHDIAVLLDRYARDAPSQLKRLASAAAFFVLTGNADAHGKNLALLHPDPEHVELAPLYDTVPTALWTNLRKTLAMSVCLLFDADKITIDHFVRETAKWPLAEKSTREAVEETVTAVQQALDPDEHPELAELVQRRARSLLGK